MGNTCAHAEHRQRIKLRYLKNGLHPFLDYEVLEFILTYAIARKDVKPVAKALLERFKTLNDVFNAPLEELVKIPGIGIHSALLLRLIRDCVERYLHGDMLKTDCISSTHALVRYCIAAMAYNAHEQFRVIYLNTKNRVIADEVVQQGTIDHIAIYPRTIVEHSLRHKAKALIFVHNHPSGDPVPSPQDRDLTQRLIAAVEPLSINVHDHIIIGKNGYYSFREHGEL
ncbi:MAG: DNA repair protein RadC [Desulfobacterota bacterium]|nr:DNA repair protein RadC [Thermodesulfobacteriota bacterium]